MSDPDTSHRNEPPALKLPPGIPDAPKCVTENAYALAEWNRMVKALSAQGVLTLADMAILSLYCMAWAEVQEIDRLIDDCGRYQEHKGYRQLNPEVNDLNSQRSALIVTLKELGFTPASRAKMKIAPPKPVNKLAAFNARGAGTAGKIGH